MNKALSQLVKRVRDEQKLSTSDVQKASQNQISDAYVSQIENGAVKNVSLEKLVALAHGLGIPDVDVIRAALGLPEDLDERFRGYASRFNAHDLSNSEWQFLETNFNDMVQRFIDERAIRLKQIEDMFRENEALPISES